MRIADMKRDQKVRFKKPISRDGRTYPKGTIGQVWHTHPHFAVYVGAVYFEVDETDVEIVQQEAAVAA